MSKFVRISRLTVFPVVAIISILAFILIKAPELQERDNQIKLNAEAARNLQKGREIIKDTGTAIILWDERGNIISVSDQAAQDLNMWDLEGRSIYKLVSYDKGLVTIKGHEDLDLWLQQKKGKGGLLVIRPKGEDPKEKMIKELEDKLENAQRPLFPPQWAYPKER